MTNDAYRFLLDTLEARRNARFALHSGLPGRIIYFKAEMRRAIRNWREYANARRAV